jgi:hypothetical protein
MIWIQVALLVAGTAAMIWGAFAHIGWLFWGVGLPVELVAFIYTIIAAGFFQLWANERRAAGRV